MTKPLEIGPHLAALISILVCLLTGDVMMRGEAAEIRRSLAISTAIRNVALAFLIVGTNFPGTPAVTIAFVFGLYSLIVGFTYGKLMTRSATEENRDRQIILSDPLRNEYSITAPLRDLSC
jgi:predicted Na+-dependent transporter